MKFETEKCKSYLMENLVKVIKTEFHILNVTSAFNRGPVKTNTEHRI